MSWAGRKGTKTQLCTGVWLQMHIFRHTHTHTRARMCISHAAVEHRASEAGCILRTLISCFRMSHSHTHTQSLRLDPCGHAVNPWIRPFMSEGQLRHDPSCLCQHASRADWQQYAKTHEQFPGSSALRSVTFSATEQSMQKSMLLPTQRCRQMRGKNDPHCICMAI